MPIVIPDPLAERIERLAHSRGFDSVTAYLDNLANDTASVDHPFAGREAEIEAGLLDALNGPPPEPINAAFWSRMYQAIDEEAALIDCERETMNT